MKRELTMLGCGVLMALSAIVSATGNARQEYLQALRSKPNFDQGEELFRTCLACHGASGGGVSDGSVPRIAGQHFSVLVGQLVDFRHNGRWDPRMVHFADARHLLNAQAIADVAAYVSQLEQRPEDHVEVGSGNAVAQGGEIYAKSCASCHGASAEGDGSHQVPQLAGQHYEYLRRQMYDAIDGRRPNFSPAHVRLFTRLAHDDIAAVADFLARTPREVAPLNPPSNGDANRSTISSGQ